MSDTNVIYNGECPICSREISMYRRGVAKHDLPIGFTDLTQADLTALGLAPEYAAQRAMLCTRGRWSRVLTPLL